jgi:hypothetical protein
MSDIDLRNKVNADAVSNAKAAAKPVLRERWCKG